MAGEGLHGHFGICFQQSFGTAYVDSMDYFPVLNENFAEKIESIQSEGIRGRFEGGPKYEGKHEFGGDFSFEAHPVLLGKIVAGWGGQSSATLQDSCYAHSFIPRTIDFDKYAAVPPCTVEAYRDAGSAHEYFDHLIDAVSLEFAHGALTKVATTMIGAGFEKIVKSAPSYHPGSEYAWHQTSISLGGAGNDEFSQVTVKLLNQLEAKGTMDGTKTPNRIKRSGLRKVEISGTVLFADDTEFDKYRAQSAQRMLINTTGMAVSSGYTGDLVIDIPSFKYTDFAPAIQGPGFIEVGFTGEAEYNVGSGTMIEITITNTVSQYFEF